MREAPPHWQVIQFGVGNPVIRRFLSAASERFLRWMPEYDSTVMMGFSLDAAKEISASSTLDISPDRFRIYTHTLNWFGTRSSATTGDTPNLSRENLPALPPAPTPGPPVVRVTTVTCTTDALRAEGMTRVTPSWISWIVISRVSDPHYISGVQNIKSIEDGQQFSKWVYVSRLQFEGDYVLVVDDDITLDAFPWATLFRFLGDNPPTITGITTESTFANSAACSSLRKKRFLRGYFSHMNAAFWRTPPPHPAPSSRGGSESDPRRVRFVEQGVTLFDAPFFRAFVHDIGPLIEYMEGSRCDWGVDLLWCGAALQFNRSRNPCAVFPYPAWHEDHGTLTGHYSSHRGNTLRRAGRVQLKWMESNDTWNGWRATSAPDVAKYGRRREERKNLPLETARNDNSPPNMGKVSQ
jgi:hypothetical protein